MTKTSELPGFYRLAMDERRARAAESAGLDPEAVRALCAGCGLSDANADNMVENAVGVMGLPLGLCVNLQVDGRDRLVPMAVEEPSVVAASSYAAKLLRAGGGISTRVSEALVVGQVQVLEVADLEAAGRAVLAAKEELLALANQGHAGLAAAGGGAIDVETRVLEPLGPSDPCGPMLVAHLVVDVRDAMGANAVNTMCERIAPRIAELTKGRVGLRILSNLTDRRLVHVTGRVPASALEGKGVEGGLALAKRIEEASVFAERDPYRAATHNKGIMNGVDAVLVALGQDWRAVEAGAHAFAARGGRYTALATWRVEGDALVGRMTIPMAVGTVGGVVAVHPTVRANRQIAGVATAAELAAVVGAVGLAQNLSALRALAAEGIQSGHMRMHARNFAIEAGANADEARAVAQLCAERKQVSLAGARAILAELRGADAPPPPAATGGSLPPPPVAIAVARASAADRGFCERMLPAVSRTFALSIQALPEALRDPVCVAYLLCRVVDTVEDDRGLTPDARQPLFDAFDAALAEAAAGGAGVLAETFEAASLREDLGTSDQDRELVRGAGAVFRCFSALPEADRRAIAPRVAEMSTGMREYSLRADAEGGLRMRDRADLERYCHYVAGTVGELLTDLFRGSCDVPERTRAELEARANAFGVGLQLVNVLKDVAEDIVRGDCFLPRDAAARAGLDLDRILERPQRARGLAVLRQVALVAREHLDRAREYTLLWPARGDGLAVRRFCAVPLALALATLREIEVGDDALLPGRAPTVSRSLVLRVFGDATVATSDDSPRGASDERLRELFAHAAIARMDPPARPRVTPVTAEPERAAEVVSAPQPAGPRPAATRATGTILIGGASTLAGANLLHRLASEGRPVRALVRGAADALAADDVAALTGRAVERADTLSAALHGCDAIVHCGGDAADLLRAAGDAGARVVLASVRPGSERAARKAFHPFARGGAAADELAPADPKDSAGRSGAFERAFADASRRGLDVVLVTAPALLGPLDYGLSALGQALVDHTYGRIRAWVPERLELGAAAELAGALLAALDGAPRGARVSFEAGALAVEELLDLFEEVSGRGRGGVRVPALLAAAMGAARPSGRPDASPAAVGAARRAVHAAYLDLARRGLVPQSPSLRRGALEPSRDPAPRPAKGAAA